MVRLHSIEIEGFQAKNRKARLEFSHDSSVSVIYGDNGCGKTTFLKLIHGILNRDTTILASENVIKVEVDFYDSEWALKKVIIEQEPNFDDEGNLIGIEYNWEQLISSPLSESKSLSLGVERGVTTQSLKIEPHDIYRFTSHPDYRSLFGRIDIHTFSERLSDFIRHNQVRRARSRRDELSLDKQHTYLQSIKMSNIESLLVERYRQARAVATERIQNALFDTLSVVVDPSGGASNVEKSKIPENFSELVTNNRERLIEALDDGFENNFKNHITQILMGADDLGEIEVIKENNLLSQLIINMISELEFEKQLLSSINTLVDTFNEYLVGSKKLVINTREIYVDINGDHHSVNVLSSGERHILTFLSLAVIAGRERDILIIDEPEISLNIKWQRTLMSLMQELVPFTQIIVASHSSLIAKKMPESLVKLNPESM
ncbi:AAA family ATPase [Shewanella waksmanii]|uniref:AAA family ATPase n=1 Tax=Shewanella waksmanii TaxID=213783 RepID=UPI00048FCB4C|nr:AAA family ATPase [Shewanella waksmanii]